MTTVKVIIVLAGTTIEKATEAVLEPTFISGVIVIPVTAGDNVALATELFARAISDGKIT